MKALRLITVLAMTVALTGCASRGMIQRMATQVDYIEAAQKRMERQMIALDSTVSVNSISNNAMRADVSTSLEEMKSQMQVITGQIDELQQNVRRLPSRQTTYQPSSRSESMEESPVTGSAETNQPAETTNNPCTDLDPAKLYDTAFDDVKVGNYDLAIPQFKDLLECFPNSFEASRSHYWLGECYYSLERYEDAIEQYQVLLDRFEDSDKVPTALYKLARCNEELDRRDKACEFYRRLLEEHPRVLEAGPARERSKLLCN